MSMGEPRGQSVQTQLRLMAVMDDHEAGCHRAFIDSASGMVTWKVDDRLVRSFLFTKSSLDSDHGSPATGLLEHAVFTRFNSEGRCSDTDHGDHQYTVALCLFHKDMLAIRYYSGEAFGISLPFSIRSVHALHVGLLVQRKVIDSAETSPFAANIPTIFSLLSARGEFKVLGVKRALDTDYMRRQRGKQTLLSPTPTRPSAHTAGGAAAPILSDPAITIVDTAISRRDSVVSQYVLCWNSSEQSYVVFRGYVMDPLQAEKDSIDATVTEPELDDASGSAASNISDADFEFSLDVDMDVDYAAGAGATSRRKSGFGSAMKNDRRSSMLGRASFNDSPGFSYAVDMLCEQKQMRADFVLHMCWKERYQRSNSQRNDTQEARICIIHSYSGVDIICIFSTEAGEVIGVDSAGLVEVFRHAARSIASIRSTRSGLDDLLLVTPDGQLALVPGSSGSSDPIGLDISTLSTTGVAHIDYTTDGVAVVTLEDGRIETVSVGIHTSSITSAVMDVLSMVLSKSSGSVLRRTIIALASKSRNVCEEIDQLAHLISAGADRSHLDVDLPQCVRNELCERAPAVIYALMMVYNDSALRRDEPRTTIDAMEGLVARFVRANGMAAEHQGLLFLGFGLASFSGTANEGYLEQAMLSSNVVLPSFTKWMLALTNASNVPPVRFPSLASVNELFGIADAETFIASRDPLRLLSTVADVLYRFATARDTGAAVFYKLANESHPMQLLLQLTPDMQWLIRSVIEHMRTQCDPSWPKSVLALLGRDDLTANAAPDTPLGGSLVFGTPDDSDITFVPVPTTAAEHDEKTDRDHKPQAIAEICEKALSQSANDPANNTGISLGATEISSVAFSQDLRVEEAERMLNISAIVHADLPQAGTASPEAADAAKAQYMDILACRTLALAVGRAAFGYSTMDLNLHDALPISHPQVHACFRGYKIKTTWSPPSEVDISWPLFHSGVLAALSIERCQAKSAHPSWVLLNWPAEIPAEIEPTTEEDRQKHYKDSLASHAGFILGMGLLQTDPGPASSFSHARHKPNGPLCNMPPWQVFKYLSIRHGLTSIALLLGCACAHRGTMDASVSKILSLHIPTLLPPGSSELMLLSHGTQAAAMLGLGLLFMGSQNRRMSEVMLGELSAIRSASLSANTARLDGADPTESTAECYSLATGFALGLVVLGQGLSTRSLADLRLLDALTEIINGTNSGWSSNTARHESETDMLSRLSIAPNSSVDAANGRNDRNGGGAVSEISDLGAVAALGLVFIGTNYLPAAQRLAIPTSSLELQAVDPFMLLWKSLMYSLIMLADVSPTRLWVESRVPLGITADSSPDMNRARLNVVTASCFAIGLKYAGTEDQSALATVLAYFDEIETIARRPALGYEPSLTRSSAQSCLDTICISAALVMAGSGDIDTMRRLRSLDDTSASRTYGNHMASHLALGLLFIGGGARFTLSHSLGSLAVLVIALFPRYPQSYTDNGEHLQAWRHLWSLCVEPRCLLVRDVVSGRMCRDSVITLVSKPAGGEQSTLRLSPPVRFPSLEHVTCLRVAAPGYLPLSLDIGLNPDLRQIISKRRIIYIQPARSDRSLIAAEAKPELGSVPEHRAWLSASRDMVFDICQKMRDALHDLENPSLHSSLVALTSSAVRAIQHIRMCASYLRAMPVEDQTVGLESYGYGLTEDTQLAWLDIQDEIRKLGRMDSVRRVLTEYWAGDQISETMYCVVSIISASMDIPKPTEMSELKRLAPVASIIAYFLDN
ncbi:Anaphase-promoting complex subunit 1 [Coemansia interrupta]|uniref:Anaphase-promoting complex subunit 1 n=1 Tax=Coemansia interrupta TaxID=1126814 RepID=A0A9W8LG38_9FUNG|nr:Anaphase-promoting complex subunit 1 [Coemansia interrupta]